MNARVFLTACASAALLSTVACSNTGSTAEDRNANGGAGTPPAASATPNAAGTSGTAADSNATPQPITLTGCLQKGDHDDYILTEINEPKAGAAENKNEGKVEREDLNAAEHAYRLKNENGKDSDLDSFVGRQVRVRGTLAKQSDIDQKIGTSGSNDKQPKLRDSDLAQVDVSDVQQTAAACGSHAAKRSSTRKPRTK